LQINGLLEGETSQVVNSLGVSDELEIVFLGGTQHREDDAQLILRAVGESSSLDVVGTIRRQGEARGTGEQGRSVQESGGVFLDHAQELSKDTTEGPDIDRGSVVLFEENEFRSSVPSGDDVTSKLSLDVLGLDETSRGLDQLAFTFLGLGGGVLGDVLVDIVIVVVGFFLLVVGTFDTFDGSSETEIADSDGAIFVDEDVSGLEITMEDVSSVNILETDEDVVDQGLDMDEFQVDGRLEELLEIGLSIFQDYVEGVKGFIVRGLKDFDDVHKIGVNEVSKKHDFSKNSLAINDIFEDFVETLDGDLLASRFLDGLNDVTVRAGADLFNDLVVWADFPILEGLGKGVKLGDFLFLIHCIVSGFWKN